jgi:hypothetical protein
MSFTQADSSFMPVVGRYQPIANSNALGDRVLPAVAGNKKFALNFQLHANTYCQLGDS